MSEEKMRAEFEAWYLKEMDSSATTEKFLDTEYYNDSTMQDAWRGYQQATATATDSKQREIAELSAQVEVMRTARSCRMCNNTGVYVVDDSDSPLTYSETCDCTKDKSSLFNARCITPSSALLAIENEAAAKALEEVPDKIDWLRHSEQGRYITERIMEIAAERRNRK